jgi:hypothetical protein
MDIRVGNIKFTDDGDQIKIIRLNSEDGTLNVEMIPKDGSKTTKFAISRDYYISLNDALLPPRVPNMKPGFVGIKNCGYSCFMNSVFQSVIKCKPLLRKLMEIKLKPEGRRSHECSNEIIDAFYRVIYLLNREKGTINIQFFLDAIEPFFSRMDDPSLFLDTIFTNLLNCGYLSIRNLKNQFLGFHWDLKKPEISSNKDLMALIEHSTKSCLTIATLPGQHLQEAIATVEQNIFLSDQQNFIVIHPDNDRAEGISSRLPQDGVISIRQHRFRVSSVIIRVGTGHYYTITWDGRYDDDNVEEDPQFMINLLANGFDIQIKKGVVRHNNGCFYFFERIGEREEHSGMRDEDTFGSSAMDHSSRAEDTFGSSTTSHSQMYIDAQKLFDKFERHSGFFRRLLVDLETLSVIDKIEKKKIMLNNTLSLLKNIRIQLININNEFQKLFGITQVSPRFIEMEKMIIDLNKLMEREIQRKNEQQVASDEKVARELVAKEAKERADKERADRERADRERAAKERAAKERADREQITRDERLAKELEAKESTIQRQIQSDESLARRLHGKGGNLNYQNKYLIYKEKYLLLKKKINN